MADDDTSIGSTISELSGLSTFRPLESSTSIIGSSDPLGLLAAQIEANKRRLQEEEAQSLARLGSTRQDSFSESGVGAALAALPILIGLAAKGKKGAEIGAKAGLLGSSQFFGGLERDKAKREAIEELNLRNIQKQQSDLNRDVTRLGVESAKISSREAEGEKNRAIRAEAAKLRNSEEITQLNPLARQGVEDLLKGIPLSSEGLTAMLEDPKSAHLGLRIAELQGVGSRFSEKKEREETKAAIPGYSPAKGFLNPRPETADRLKKEAGATDQAIFYLEEIKNIIKRRGADAITGVDPAILGQISGAIFNAKRIETGSGARLEGPEAKFLEAYIPETLGGKGILAYTKGKIFKRDPLGFIERTQKLLRQAKDVQLAAGYGLLSKEGNYPPGFLESKGLEPGGPVASSQKQTAREGQQVRGPDGKTYIIRNGKPELL